MFGIVNCAIRDHIVACYGEAMWAKVLRSSKASADEFVSMENYSDEVTLSLVQVCAEETDVSMVETLENIGLFWAEFSLGSDFGPLLGAAGKNFPEVLNSLDSLHTRLGLAFQEMSPPSFWCTKADETQTETLGEGRSALVLHYVSDRNSLWPMVRGIILGLGKMLSTECRLEQIADKADGADHDAFLVIYDSEVVSHD